MALARLDKLLSLTGERSRSEAGKLIRAGLVYVNGIAVRDPAFKADAAAASVTLNGTPVRTQAHHYVMLHKPAGLLTAARDRKAPTVMDLLPAALLARDVMPVGRLDKDTTGLLLFTNDGALAHRLLAPKTHVWKEYLAMVDGELTPAHVQAFAQGIELHGFQALPGELTVLSSAPCESKALVKLREGKYHQVKRMFAALGLSVTALHRQAFGPLRLSVAQGEHRPLSQAEIQALYQAAQMDKEENHG